MLKFKWFNQLIRMKESKQLKQYFQIDQLPTPMISQVNSDKIVFGSFPFRGTMQPVRLICQHIEVQYENQFFNPVEWEEYKKNEAKDWLYQKIPFMKCGNLIITNGMAAAQYVIQKFNRKDLFGRTQQQTICINSSVSFQSIIMGALSLQCDMKKSKLQDDKKKSNRQKFWREKFYPKFKKAEQVCKGPWFFDHISMIDFFIYEDYLLFSKIYPEMKNFNKVREVFQNVSNLPAVSRYQNSNRSIKQICPNKYFQNFAVQFNKLKELKQQSCRSPPCSAFCNQKKQIQTRKPGFCPYQKKNDEQMDLE